MAEQSSDHGVDRGAREHLWGPAIATLIWLPFATWLVVPGILGIPVFLVALAMGRWLRAQLVGPAIQTVLTLLASVPLLLLIYAGALEEAFSAVGAAFVILPILIAMMMPPSLLGFGLGRAWRNRDRRGGVRRAWSG